MSNDTKQASENKRQRFFIPALLLSVFLFNTFAPFFGIVLIDISNTFQVTVGTASQILTVTRFTGLISGLIMGLLSIRFKHKSLFLVGIALYSIGALGSALSPDLISMMLFQTFIGFGGGMTTIMTYALIGEHLPLVKRGWAIGLVWSMIFITNVIMSLLTAVFTNLGGWQATLSWFIFPVGIITLAVGLLVLPSKTSDNQKAEIYPYFKAFKEIFSSKSTIACMLSSMLVSIFATTPLYAPSFYRSQFEVSLPTAALFASIVAATGIFGGLLAGAFFNRIGRKNLAIISGFASGIANVIFTFIPNMYISVFFWGVAAFSVSITWAAVFGLTLEQAPSFRGTMMSMNHSFRYVGAIAGLIIGGLVLNAFNNNYHIVMIIFGASNIALAFILLLFAKDPCKQ